LQIAGKPANRAPPLARNADGMLVFVARHQRAEGVIDGWGGWKIQAPSSDGGDANARDSLEIRPNAPSRRGAGSPAISECRAKRLILAAIARQRLATSSVK
jgi:hypothetical protein